MKKIVIGVFLGLFAVASPATTHSIKQAKQPAQSAYILKSSNSNTYLKHRIEKKRLDDKVWNKQADEFIGSKRTNKPYQNQLPKRIKVVEQSNMLTAQNLQESLGSI